jgi:hypothetical protein
MKYHRYHLEYRWDHAGGYCVVDTEKERKVVFSSLSKSETIGECQRLNGYTVDGNEQTYAEQVR